jgi:hypothetical protein
MGNIKVTAEEIARAKFIRYAKKAKRKKSKNAQKTNSVQTVSGGLPSLGKRR